MVDEQQSQDRQPINEQPVVDIDENRLMAALSYVGILVLVPLLMKKSDPFVYWHIKQGLVILAGIILAILAAAWISVVGNVLFLILMILDLIALVQALLGKRWKIPIIGDLADQFRI